MYFFQNHSKSSHIDSQILYIQLNSKNPSIRVYKAKIGEIYQVEMKIAAKRNKLAKHFQKWDKLLPHIGL